jgi:hypothetical protein
MQRLGVRTRTLLLKRVYDIASRASPRERVGPLDLGGETVERSPFGQGADGARTELASFLGDDQRSHPGMDGPEGGHCACGSLQRVAAVDDHDVDPAAIDDPDEVLALAGPVDDESASSEQEGEDAQAGRVRTGEEHTDVVERSDCSHLDLDEALDDAFSLRGPCSDARRSKGRNAHVVRGVVCRVESTRL